MARDSFVCNASIVGLWLGRWSVARGSFVCNVV